jgi:DNA-binding PadR family transcriptional regulator
MKKINKAKYAILGMLFEKTHSGYSLLQTMKGSTNYFWQESDASVYPMLKLLEKNGMVISHNEATGKRERTIFEITDMGKKEFLAWMKLQPEEETSRSELRLKLFFGAHTDKETVLKYLKTHQEECFEDLKNLQHIETEVNNASNENPHKTFWLITIRSGVIHAQAELQWLEECFNILKKK